MSKRILVCEYHQETDTFNPIVSRAERFNEGGPFEGEELFQLRMSNRNAVSGGVDAIREAGGEAVFTIAMHATSGGRMDDALLKEMKERVQFYTETVGAFDGVYAALHGATCTETCDDACGDFLEFLRSLVGERPIAASFDLHANITEKVLKNADIVCGFQTYPHLDIYETGYRAANLLMQKLKGKAFYMATVHLPMLVPPAGYTTDTDPLKGVVDQANRAVDEGKLLDYSIFVVQPWLDVPKIAGSVVAIGEDPAMAKKTAEGLARDLFAIREGLEADLLPVDTIIDLAEANSSGKPVILADAADSPRGGAVGDSPYVAIKVLESKKPLQTCIFVVDPPAVRKAFELGVGGEGTFSVGAGFTPGMPGPLVAQGRVCSLHDGYFMAESGRRGATSYIGNAAVVRFGTVDILLCEQGGNSGDPQHFRHFGMEPTFYDLVVVKANTSFRAHYAKITDLMYVGDTPGAGASNLRQLNWKHLPQGLYPFDLPEDYRVEEAKLW